MKAGKFIIGCLTLLLCVGIAAAPQGMKKKQPGWQGKGKNRVLFLNGGRPWQGEDAFRPFVNSGLRVRGLTSWYLAGEGGATIKTNVGDKVEPTPHDGITPAFKMLKNYHLVVFHHIPERNMINILTPERIAALKTYVENGGHVLFAITVPDSADELLPVTFEGLHDVEENLFATRPDSKFFKDFPKKMPVFRSFKLCSPKDGATVLSMIQTQEGDPVAPYFARWNIGKGTVSFLNAQVTYPRMLKELKNWGYCDGFLLAAAADCAGFNEVDPAKFFKKMMPIVAPVQQDTVVADVAAPELGVSVEKGDVTVSGNTAVFANGTTLSVNVDGTVNITYPGKAKPFIKNYQIPVISCEGNQVTYDSTTHEATSGNAETVASGTKWQYAGLTKINNNEVAVNYTAADGKMKWIFKAGKLNLDGRKLNGFAERVEIIEFNKMIQQISFKGSLDLESPQFARRFSCYSPPRGYADFDMSGKTTGDTFTWNYFGSGQPFEYITCKNGIYLANVATPQATTVKLIRKQGEKYITFSRDVNIGRCKAPQTAVDYWHWYGDGKERGHNDYLAMYQFQRQELRRAAGLGELPSYPMVACSAQLTRSEKEAVIDKAIELGYRYVHTSGFETPIEHTFGADNNESNRAIAAKGIKPHLWSAGSYVQGDGGWIINNHPEWFVKDQNGKIFAYGQGRYPVIDVNNQEFVDWYKKLVKESIDAGVGWVYRDMDGAASRAVNYARPESPDGMPTQIDIYKFFQQNGCLVGIEGMNPLVLDEYWYREAKYVPFAGNEFCLVGSVPSGNFADALNLDPFRTAMYGCYPTFCLSGYTYGFDRIPGENERAEMAVKYVKKINEALDLAGMPYVRETAFGTTWYGKNGGALFFCNPTKKAVINLPQGWVIDGIEGNVLTDVPAYTMYVLKKQ